MNSDKNEIKVSVIVPVYNVERYLRQSILSIINQTLREIEIILIDDGSTDSSLSIMEELANMDSRIKIFSQPNYGQSVARNVGFIHATGEYIYFFDSDDILEERALEDCYIKCQHRNLDFIFFDADIFSDDNVSNDFMSYNRTEKFEDKTFVGVELLKEQLVNNTFSASVCLMFIRRNFLSNLNIFFYPKIIHEDELFVFLLYLKASKVGLIKQSYFHRRLRPNSTMTSVFGMKNAFGYITVCRELKNYASKYDVLLNEKKLINQRISSLIANLFYKSLLMEVDDRSRLIKIIKVEFLKYLDLKTILKIYIPFINNLYKRIKQKRK